MAFIGAKEFISLLILLSVDLFFVGYPYLLFWMAIVFGCVIFPLCLISRIRKKLGRIAKFLFVFICLDLILIAVWTHVVLTKLDHHLMSIGVVCEEYKLKYKKYPDDLADLVPEFINEMPRHKISILRKSSYFGIRTEDKRHWISTYFPIRRFYQLEEKRIYGQ